MDQLKVFTTERAGKWHFDGQGINCDADRFLTSNKDCYVPSTHGNRENPDHHTVGKTFADFANQAHRLKLQTYHKQDDLPTIHLNVDIDELRAMGVGGHHVLAVVVTLANGKQGRLHLSLIPHEKDNRVKAILRVPYHNSGEDKDRSLAMRFEDWKEPVE